MLEIINPAGRVLELSDDVSIPVERNNMLFNNNDTLLQDVVYSESAPLSPSNKLFISFGHLVEADSDVYKIAIQAKLQGMPFFVGDLKYTIKNNKIDFKLLPNFASFTNLLSNNLISDIDAGDAVDDLTVANYEALMKDTCVNPQNYPYIFCPVWNTRLGEDLTNPAAKRDFINFWDYANQKFIADAFNTGFLQTLNTPYLKLIAIFRQIAKNINCNITGDWQNTAEANSIYIESLKAEFGTSVSSVLPGFKPSAYYLPDSPISDFLKQTKDRLHLSFNFDLKNNEWQIESFDTAIKKAPIKIGDFVENVNEININEGAEKGFNINLKVNDKDSFWNSGTTDLPDYKPNFNLLIAAAAEKKELAVSTLLNYENGLKKNVKSNLLLKDYTSDADAKGDKAWPLRFFIYNGMTLIEPGKYWPQTTSFDLNLSDAKIYQFLNYSKQYRLTANIPIKTLRILNSTSVIEFYSKEGSNVQAIIEKLTFDLRKGSQYIKCDILCRNILYTEKTKANLRNNYAVENQPGNTFFRYKSNLKNLLPIVIITLADPAATKITLETTKNHVACNNYGISGVPVSVNIPINADFMGFTSNWQLTFKINQGIPKELRIGCKKYLFTLQPSGFYEATFFYKYQGYLDYFIVY